MGRSAIFTPYLFCSVEQICCVVSPPLSPYIELFSYNSIDEYKGFPEIGLIMAMCFMFSGRYSKIRHAIPIWREGMDTVKQPVWVSFFLIFLYKQAQICGEGYPLDLFPL